MNGGTISNNTAGASGGLAVVRGATCTINDGTIQYNSGNEGGGVYIESATVTMNGGTISNNTAGSRGGGIFARKFQLPTSPFTMTGGTISNNTAVQDGGGVYLTATGFSKTGGTISGNTATPGRGHQIYSGGVSSPYKYRDSAVGSGEALGLVYNGSSYTNATGTWQ
jgi:predicted outer membrane repeat protein